MNHTIKGIIISAAIASMLVLGATMVPIMQNSFAHKRSYFEKASDPNTNTNTNTNSADSSSTSDATAENTNNINNTATASSNQNQNACAVAVTCSQGTTTVGPPTPPPIPPGQPCAGFVFDVHLREASGDFPKGTEICLFKPGENSPTASPPGATIIPPNEPPIPGQTVRIDHATGGNCPGGTHVDVDTGNPPDGFSLGEIACVTIST